MVGYCVSLCVVAVHSAYHPSGLCLRAITDVQVPFIDRVRTTRHESSANEEQERLHLFRSLMGSGYGSKPHPPGRTLAKLHSRQALYWVICFMFDCLFAQTANQLITRQPLGTFRLCGRAGDDTLATIQAEHQNVEERGSKCL